jgi:hypothetical protein
MNPFILFFTGNPLGRWLARLIEVLVAVFVVCLIVAGLWSHFMKVEKENTSLKADVGALVGKVVQEADQDKKQQKAEVLSDNLDIAVIKNDKAIDTRTSNAVQRIKAIPIPLAPAVGPGLVDTKTQAANDEAFHAAIIAEIWSGHCLDVDSGPAACSKLKPIAEAS